MSPHSHRQSMVIALTQAPVRAVVGLRPVTAGDASALGVMMYRAYFNTVDYDGETEAEGIHEVERTFSGAHGDFDWNASSLIEVGGAVVSAALITRWQGRPFLAFSMTDPTHQRNGFARASLVHAMQALLIRGERELGLFVTASNAPAVSLYSCMGFRRQHDA